MSSSELREQLRIALQDRHFAEAGVIDLEPIRPGQQRCPLDPVLLDRWAQLDETVYDLARKHSEALRREAGLSV